MKHKYLTEQELSSYIKDIPIDVGRSQRYNHKGCASTSTSKSLQIWRPYGHSYNAYCFKCGKSGRIDNNTVHIPQRKEIYSESNRVSFRPVSRRKSNQLKSSSHDKNDSRSVIYEYPAGAVGRLEQIPLRVVQTFQQIGITRAEIARASVEYNPDSGRIILPIQNAKKVTIGYQEKVVPGLSKYAQPKFLTNTPEPGYFFQINNLHSKRIALVEDHFSCIKCSRVINSIALLGSNLSKDLLDKLKGMDVFIVLDNDNSKIKRKQREFQRDLQVIANSVTIIRLDKDPKYLTDEELKDLFT